MKPNAKTIAIFGGDGQLGMDLRGALAGYAVESLAFPDMDIRDRASVANALERIRPAWVINAAAHTHVDRCEDQDLAAFQVNALGAKHVADKSRAVGARVIQISTDYVFDGKKRSPYTEADPTGPLNVYGMTKLAGERYVSQAGDDNIIVRTSGLYGVHACWGKGRNFVDTMLALAKERDKVRVVVDEVLTPTLTEDLAAALRELIESSPAGGIYHATNEGACSWFEFAGKIFELSEVKIHLERTTSAEWKATAKRPAYSVLENTRLKAAGLGAMPRWENALERYLDKQRAKRR